MTKTISDLMKPGEWWSGNLRFPKYLVGSHGQVMSMKSKSPKILSPIRMGNYDGYQLSNEDGKIVKVYRHRLVAETFIGPCPDGFECRHLDGDKSNADISNLRWGSPKQNSEDKLRHGTHKEGASHPGSKLSDESVIGMKERRTQGMAYNKIANEFGVSTMTAFRAIKGMSWRNVNG